ncbi:short chain dehydrogenase [mine drainage metagenome]|uniref:Short chain dehydrogenase n=1 Tax=mine drainage metagenome TaxID=410659 RepID=A0A1J5PBM4_9ZZZZ
MRVLVVGATGAVGKAVVTELAARHEVLQASRSSGIYPVDIAQASSIAALFKKTGKIDAIVAAFGNVHFGLLGEMTGEQFRIGINNKLMGQVELVLQGQHYLNDGGSITLTSGILSDEPIRLGANASAVNRAVEGFVCGAAVELPRGMRINVVSASVLVESLPTYAPFFIGFDAVPAARVAMAYARSVDGADSGKIYRVR